jgi:hypothetical protein
VGLSATLDVAVRFELRVELVDLCDQFVDALADILAALIRVADLLLKLADTLAARIEVAMEWRVLVAKARMPFNE